MRRLTAVFFSLILLTSCQQGPQRQQKISMFVGVDVSGSFLRTGNFDDSLDFLAYYLYGHLNEIGGLKPLKNLFVGSIGGSEADEAKSLHPIHEFEGKSVDEIRAKLGHWFRKSESMTDFNMFFTQCANVAQKRNLSLSPIVVVLLTDGLPDTPGKSQDKYENINVAPMEYISRNTTIRVLYENPVRAHRWETLVPRKRVRLWTVDDQVMRGWKSQIKPDTSIKNQEKLWKWVTDIVDFRVQSIKIKSKSSKK